MPSAQDYNEAIQAPERCFIDSALRQGSVRVNAMGLPVAVSGAFASVYELTVPNNGTWAIKCFIRGVPDQQRRYAEISKILGSLKSPFTAEFQYQQSGIRVNGSVQPIVKMEWLRGDQLGEYVRKNVNDPTKLKSLATKWRGMVGWLYRNNIAHGDLQHGNVLVVNHELKLVDYDGMFVPAFRGMLSNEKGHPNYQHPKRSEADFGTYTDNFSAWIIYASLRILAVAPDTYSLVRGLGREECLLFNREDFFNPGSSPFLGSLKFHAEPTVTKLAEHVERLLSFAPRDVPPLETSDLDDGERISISTGADASGWWKDVARDKPAASVPPPPQPRLPAPEVEQVFFSENPRAEIAVFIFVFGSFLAFCFLSGPMGVVGYLIVQLGMLLALRVRMQTLYERCPEAGRRERLMLEVVSKVEELEKQSSKRDSLSELIPGLRSRLSGLATRFQSERAALTLKQGEEVKAAHTSTAVARSEVERRKRSLEDDEKRACLAAVGIREQELVNLQKRLSEIDVQRARFLKSALEQLQQNTLKGLLQKHYISGTSLPGIGDGFKSKLAGYGIATAADVERWAIRRIRGFGATRTQTLLSWRESLVTHYSGRIPTSLPAAELQRAESQFQAQRNELQSKIRQVQQVIEATKQQVTMRFAPQRTALAQQDVSVTKSGQQTLEQINARYASSFGAMQRELEQQKRALEREIANAQLNQTNVEADIRHLQQWQIDIAPQIKAFEKINREEFVRFVLLSTVKRPWLSKERN